MKIKELSIILLLLPSILSAMEDDESLLPPISIAGSECNCPQKDEIGDSIDTLHKAVLAAKGLLVMVNRQVEQLELSDGKLAPLDDYDRELQSIATQVSAMSLGAETALAGVSRLQARRLNTLDAKIANGQRIVCHEQVVRHEQETCNTILQRLLLGIENCNGMSQVLNNRLRILKAYANQTDHCLVQNRACYLLQRVAAWRRRFVDCRGDMKALISNFRTLDATISGL